MGRSISLADGTSDGRGDSIQSVLNHVLPPQLESAFNSDFFFNRASSVIRISFRFWEIPHSSHQQYSAEKESDGLCSWAPRLQVCNVRAAAEPFDSKSLRSRDLKPSPDEKPVLRQKD
jgi:hypothetical protein